MESLLGDRSCIFKCCGGMVVELFLVENSGVNGSVRIIRFRCPRYDRVVELPVHPNETMDDVFCTPRVREIRKIGSAPLPLGG